MSTLAVLAIILIPLAFLAFMLLRERGQAVARASSTCGDTPHPGGTVDASAWHIGPVLRGFGAHDGNRSPGMPPHPAPNPDGGFIIDFPTAAGHKVDYVTFNHGPLKGRRQITLRYRLELDPGANVYAVPEPANGNVFSAQITLYFQRAGDDWSSAGKFGAYRWYATFLAPQYVAEGAHTVVAPLDGAWTGAGDGVSAGSDPAGFQLALEDTCCVGFVFGGNDIGYGHGAAATGKARLIVDEFSVS